MHIQVVLGFLVFATCYGFGNTCSCFPTTVEEKYCRADFVLKVRVRSALQNPSGEQNFDDYYRIKRVRAPWKFNFENFVLMKNRVYTASNGALCGVSLQKGQKYLISGTVDKNAGKMRIDYCTAIVYRTPVARSIKKLKLSPPNCENLLAPVKIKEPTRRRK